MKDFRPDAADAAHFSFYPKMPEDGGSADYTESIDNGDITAPAGMGAHDYEGFDDTDSSFFIDVSPDSEIPPESWSTLIEVGYDATHEDTGEAFSGNATVAAANLNQLRQGLQYVQRHARPSQALGDETVTIPRIARIVTDPNTSLPSVAEIVPSEKEMEFELVVRGTQLAAESVVHPNLKVIIDAPDGSVLFRGHMGDRYLLHGVSLGVQALRAQLGRAPAMPEERNEVHEWDATDEGLATLKWQLHAAKTHNMPKVTQQVLGWRLMSAEALRKARSDERPFL